jgi:hypothetical protein
MKIFCRSHSQFPKITPAAKRSTVSKNMFVLHIIRKSKVTTNLRKMAPILRKSAHLFYAKVPTYLTQNDHLFDARYPDAHHLFDVRCSPPI